MPVPAATVLASEVHDLRVCLKSADKELKELKEERKEERRAYEAKKMARLQQVSTVIILLHGHV